MRALAFDLRVFVPWPTDLLLPSSIWDGESLSPIRPSRVWGSPGIAAAGSRFHALAALRIAHAGQQSYDRGKRNVGTNSLCLFQVKANM